MYPEDGAPTAGKEHAFGHSHCLEPGDKVVGHSGPRSPHWENRNAVTPAAWPQPLCPPSEGQPPSVCLHTLVSTGGFVLVPLLRRIPADGLGLSLIQYDLL
jgi:hypothetical protein